MRITRLKYRAWATVVLLVGVPVIGRGQSTGVPSAPAPADTSRPSQVRTEKVLSSALVPVLDGGVTEIVARHKGNVILVNFWATWCSPCREELPHLLKLEKELASEGFRLVVVSADEPEQALEAGQFLDSIGAKPPRYIKRTSDTDAFISAVDSTWSGALPAVFLYDRTGKRVNSFVGETDIQLLVKTVRALVKDTTLGVRPKQSK